jgi:hypothetical protein
MQVLSGIFTRLCSFEGAYIRIYVSSEKLNHVAPYSVYKNVPSDPAGTGIPITQREPEANHSTM